MPRTRVLTILVFSVVWSLFGTTASAAPAHPTSIRDAYNNARSLYLDLKNRDEEVSDLSRWERAASRLEDFVEENPKTNYTPNALFLLGRLYERTYEKRQYSLGLTKAVYAYERLAREFRGHYLVDDALLSLGDLRRNTLKDEVAARVAYYEIVDVYPKGDKIGEARKRLGFKKEEDPRVASSEGIKKSNGKKVEAAEVLTPSPSEKPSGSGLFSLFGDGKKESKKIYSKKVSLDRPVIVIDPGHGGEEPGARGVVEGIVEKEIVLNISLFLDELLRERLRAKTILTRARDMGMPLEERTQIANENQADLFISIHTNATDFHSVNGIETYYLDNTRDKASLKLAERENISMGKSIGDVSFIISDLIQSVKMDESISLAHHVQGSLHKTLSRYYKGVKSLGVKKAPFFVLVGAHMPCVLVEVSFIDHPVEGKRLAQRRYQKLVAKGIFFGVREFFEREQSNP